MADATQYKNQLKALLPRGAAWNKDESTTLDKVMQGFADELARVDAKALNLLQESDPRTTITALTDWERLLDLPSDCTTEEQTIQERRNAVVAKFASQGGQSAAYFIEVAAAIGYTITISEPFPFIFGSSRFGDALYGSDWIFWFIVNGDEFSVNYFRFGSSAFGEPFASWSNEQLECALEQVKPAHVNILFLYT